MEEKYDTALLGILQHEGKIERFLDVIFGFLFRRTDFYRIMKSKEDRMGFPPGIAAKMISSIYQRYESLAASVEDAKEKQREQRERKKKEQTTDTSPAQSEVPQVVAKTVEVKTDKSDPSESNTDTTTVKTDSVDTQKPSAISDRSKTNGLDSESQEVSGGGSAEKGGKGDGKDTGKAEGEIKYEKDRKKKGSRTDEEDDDPELTRQQKIFQSDPESYNGARRENYRWAQSITDLDLRINVPSHIKKGRDARVETGGKHVKVEYKDTAGTWLVAVDGDLTWDVHKDETVWSLVPGDHIHINLEKKEERWWESFFTDEPKISVRKIDASRPMSDLDQEAQAKIEEMMYNDRQKKMGLPQTHETKMHDMLRQAWDAEGSPFKGQPFDPSKFSVDPSGVMKMKP